MSTITLYHGTHKEFDIPLLSASKNRRDFGKGFYLTTDLRQAKRWAQRQADINGLKEGVVIKFEILESDFQELATMNLFEHSFMWLDIIFRNRKLGGIQHPNGIVYDVMVGPVADGNIQDTLAEYEIEMINSKEARRKLNPSKYVDQYSFHTEEALSKLKKVGLA